MKHIITGILLVISTPAIAQTSRVTITDHFTTETVQTPVKETQCRNVEVPVYRQTSGSTGDAVAGAIIGGIIGNQFGSGDGKDAMTILGAIAGADAASRNRTEIIGYRTERQCSDVTTYRNERVRQYNHSTATFTVDGKQYSLDFVK